MLLWLLSVISLLTGLIDCSVPPEVACPRMASTMDFEKPASLTICPMAWDYFKSGAMMELTLKDNMEAYKKYTFRPRMLHDVSQRDLSVTVLGSQLSMPIGISPSAMQMLAHPEGENGTAVAAAEAGTVMILSTLSTKSLEEVAASAPNGLHWFQLYVFKDRALTQNLVQRAEAAGYKALVLTVDSPLLGDRWADKRNKFVLPNNLSLANLKDYNDKNGFGSEGGSGLSEYFAKQLDPSLSWKDIQWLKNITKLPIVIKGVLTGEDAEQAVENGASAIMVSNHGGRQLDGAPATLDALPEVVRAVNGRCEVYMDGGVRTGTDVLKALALGAKAVFYARPNIWGLAYGGSKGSKCILDIMRQELDNAMALSGYTKIEEIEPRLVVRRSCYSDCREF